MAEQRLDLEEIFFAARQKPPQERGAYLDQVCGADALLRQRAEQFLSAQGEIGSFLESGAVPLEATIDEPITERPGTIIGAYKLMEQLGEGGMGLVFVAEQQHPVRRKVALKVIKPGMDTRQVVARFEAERQALALMDHPNIAKVHDGGTAPSGRPYFVMELVKGAPITEFCDQNQIAVRERLELFLDVCQAVQHAHQKGIIHRDIKPTNVLVVSHDGTPVVKVIDFGVAKAIGQQLTDKTISTQLTQLVGTPLYMSPEQAGESALDIDTRSDIYSLGVLLYELLTGTTPFDRERFKQAGYEEMRRIIREEEPPRPSTRLSTMGQAASTVSAQRQSEPRKLSQLLRGELDWIVMKALEKDRNRRYETASAFAADVNRYLHDEPVHACPPSTRYRLRKFIRKHRRSVLAASIVAFSLIAGIVGTSIGLVRATLASTRANESAEAERQAKDKAVAAQRQAMDALRATTDEVIEKLIGEKPGLTPTEKEFLEGTLKRWQAFVAEQSDSEVARAFRAEGIFKVAYLRMRLGHKDEARAGFEEAIRLYHQLAADFPTMAYPAPNLGLCYCRLGEVLGDLGKWREAEAAARQALAINEKLSAEFPTIPVYRHNLAHTHHGLGNVFESLGRLPEAQAAYRQALAIREKLADEFPGVPEHRQNLAHSHYNLGNLFAAMNMHSEAEAAYRRALVILEKLTKDFPAVREYRWDLSETQHNLGFQLGELGRQQEAKAAYSQALATLEKLAADFPTVPEYRRDLAMTYRNLGVLFQEMRKGSEAKGAIHKALAICEKLATDFPAVPYYRQLLAGTLDALGGLFAYLNKLAEAEAAYNQALAIQEKLTRDFPAVPEYRQNLAPINFHLGNLLAYIGQWQKAEAAFRRPLVILNKLAADFPDVRPYPRELALSYSRLAGVLAMLGRRPEAETSCRLALTIQDKLATEFPGVPSYRQELAENHITLGSLLADLGRRPEAEASYRLALTIQDKLAADFPTVSDYRFELAKSHANLANLLAGMGRRPEAEASYRRALAIEDRLVADYPAVAKYRSDLANSHNSLGVLLKALGKWPEAEASYRRSLAIQEKLATDFPLVVPYRLELASSHTNLGSLLGDLGKRPEAEASTRQALSIQAKLAADFPAVPEYRVNLGGSQVNLGRLLRMNQQPEQALLWYAKAIETFKVVLTQVKIDVTAQRFLRNAHWERALALNQLKRYTEAVRDWDEAVKLSLEPDRPNFRLGRAASLVLAGQVGAALGEAEELAKLPQPLILYDAACVFALAANRQDTRQGAPSNEECAKRAVALLKQAIAKGWKNVDHMKKDDDLRALRGREDFKKLLAELEGSRK
jgi:serine/threonine protein kinase/tetratricopeptide (TPR) repeat protein